MMYGRCFWPEKVEKEEFDLKTPIHKFVHRPWFHVDRYWHGWARRFNYNSYETEKHSRFK